MTFYFRHLSSNMPACVHCTWTCVQCTLVDTRAGYMYDSPDPAHLRLVPHRPPTPDHDLASSLRLKLFRRHSPGTQYSSDEIKLKEGGINNEGGMYYLLLVSHAALPSHHYFTSSLLFQLLGGEPPRAQNTTNKVKLKK